MLDFFRGKTVEVLKHGRIIEHGPVPMQIFMHGTESANRSNRAILEVPVVKRVAEIASFRLPLVQGIADHIFR